MGIFYKTKILDKPFWLWLVSIALLTNCSGQLNENSDLKQYNNINKLTKDWHKNTHDTYENVCVDKAITPKELQNIEDNNLSNTSASQKLLQQEALKKKAISKQYNINALSTNWHKHVNKLRDNPIGRYCIYIPPEDDEDEEDYNPVYEKLKRLNPSKRRVLLTPKYYPLYFGQE